MSNESLTAAERQLAETYAGYSETEIFNLIGNLVVESDSEQVRTHYALGIPNVFQRGREFVYDMRGRIAGLACPQKERFDQFLSANKESLAPIEWVGVLFDAGLSIKLTGGVPPISIAIAVGKICNYSVALLCRDFNDVGATRD